MAFGAAGFFGFSAGNGRRVRCCVPLIASGAGALAAGEAPGLDWEPARCDGGTLHSSFSRQATAQPAPWPRDTAPSTNIHGGGQPTTVPGAAGGREASPARLGGAAAPRRSRVTYRGRLSVGCLGRRCCCMWQRPGRRHHKRYQGQGVTRFPQAVHGSTSSARLACLGRVGWATVAAGAGLMNRLPSAMPQAPWLQSSCHSHAPLPAPMLSPAPLLTSGPPGPLPAACRYIMQLTGQQQPCAQPCWSPQLLALRLLGCPAAAAPLGALHQQAFQALLPPGALLHRPPPLAPASARRPPAQDSLWQRAECCVGLLLPAATGCVHRSRRRPKARPASARPARLGERGPESNDALTYWAKASSIGRRTRQVGGGVSELN
jgi:hypothetical protein